MSLSDGAIGGEYPPTLQVNMDMHFQLFVRRSALLFALGACATNAPVQDTRTALDVPPESEQSALETEGEAANSPHQQRPLAADGPQGVTGQIIVLRGNHMPGVRPAEQPRSDADAPRGAPSPNAPVHVLHGRHMPTERIDYASNAYVGTATTDAEGRFRISLPPGNYTVLTEHDERLYLNHFVAGGEWASVEVTANEWTEFDIRDTADARF